MVRIGPMASPKSLLDRRELMAGLGAAALAPDLARDRRAPKAARAGAAGAKPSSLALRAGAPATPVWSLQGARTSVQARRHPRSRVRQRTCRCPRVLNWRGIDGVPAAEPLTGRPPLAAGGKDSPPTAAAPRRDLPVRPRAARRRPGAAVAGTGAGGPGKRACRRRSRRGTPDRGLAAPRRTAPRSRPAPSPKDAAPVLYG